MKLIKNIMIPSEDNEKQANIYAFYEPAQGKRWPGGQVQWWIEPDKNFKIGDSR